MKLSFFKDLKSEFHNYNGGKLAGDIMAGITVSAVALPLALAFGVSSGASAAAGMITAIIAGIIIGALSGASYQISGPTGAMAAILLSLSASHGISGVMLAGFMSGVIILLIGVLKIGRLVSYIPAPVITGFTSGIALVIICGQIDNFFGTASAGTDTLGKLLSYGKLGFSPDLTTVLFGAGAVLIMVLWPKKLNSRFPGSLAAIIVALAVNMILNPQGIAEVGEIPRTLLLSDRLTFSSFAQINPDTVKALLPSAFGIAVLGMIESLLCGASASKMKDEPFNADRELFAQGIGNIILPFFGGIPATAAIARTSVAIKSGQRTRLTSIFHSVILLVSMFLLAPVMSRIPLAALAGVLIVTAFRMNEWKIIKYFFQKRFYSAVAQYLITMLVTLCFDLTVAIIAGVGVSILLFVFKSRLSVECSDVKADKLPGMGGGDFSNTKIVYVAGPLFFGTQEKLFSELYKFPPEIDTVILSMRGVPSIDESVIGEFVSFFGNLKTGGITVCFCGIQPEVMKVFRRSGLVEILGEGSFRWDAIEAIRSLPQSADLTNSK